MSMHRGPLLPLMIQENLDDSVPLDVVNLLRTLIPPGVWLHDEQDGNGDSHFGRLVLWGHQKPFPSLMVI